MPEVNSIEELVASGEQDLKAIADAGNTIAQEWLERLQVTPEDAMKRLYLFSEMKIALMGDPRPEARAVYKEMFEGEQL